jgi:hypothetical protein
MAVQGAPSSYSSLISFSATILSVSFDFPRNTVAYVPSPSLSNFIYDSILPKPISLLIINRYIFRFLKN